MPPAGAVSLRFPVDWRPVEPRNLSVLCGSGRRESMFSFYRYPRGGFRLVVTIGGLSIEIDWL